MSEASESQWDIGVIGSGAWGTTLAKVLGINGHRTLIWSHDLKIAEEINQHKENKSLLPGIKLPENVSATTSLEETCRNKKMVVLVVASQFYQLTAEKIGSLLSSDTLIVSATKGLEESTGQRLSEVLLKNLPKAFHKNISILSGPNISREIAEGKASTTVISALENNTAQKVQRFFNSSTLRVYTNNDIVGTEMGGTLKNIIAIAAGIIDGLGLGNNAKSAVMVRGLVEITRFATAHGAKADTLYGLAGMGDLITTCSSSLSRNHFVGEQLAKGSTLENILKGMTAVAEGVSTAKIIHHIAKKNNIEMPVTEQVYQVLFENKPVSTALKDLMNRDLKPESLKK